MAASHYSSLSGGLGNDGNNVDGRLTSPSFSSDLGLRKRDAVAIFVCLLLLRLAFAPNNYSNSNAVGGADFPMMSSHSRISASMTLAFYYPFQSTPPNINPRPVVGGGGGGGNDVEEGGNGGTGKKRTARPAPLDIDGDGVFESLVMPVFLTREDVLREEEMELEEMRLRRHHSKTTRKAEDQELRRSNESWLSEGSWGLRVLDLRPLHHDHNHVGDGVLSVGPFAPRTLFLTPLLPSSSLGRQLQQQQHPSKSSSTIYPIKLLSVQIPIQRTHLGEEEKFRQRHRKDTATTSTAAGAIVGPYGKNPNIPSKEDPLHANYDRTRHYFCGRDWHHASASCHRHCGGGMSSECGEGETCYADTPVRRILSECANLRLFIRSPQ